jgi:hypothetical protein
MSSEKDGIQLPNASVKDFMRLLKANEAYLKLTGNNEVLLKSVEDFRIALKPFEKNSFEKIISLMKLSNEPKEKQPVRLKLLDGIDIEQLPLDKLKLLVMDELLGKKELLLLAEKRLGIPIGVLKKTRKSLVKDRILNAIKNIEKFEAIEKKAGE